MIKIRKSEDRGIYDWGWLHTSHTFSFAKYYNPDFNGFRNLLVINEDIVEGNEGFGKHYHDNMEIISYVLEGELEHSDNIGNTYKIKAGEVQVMTAGTGIIHSEINPNSTPVHFFQIWIIPDRKQLPPQYNQKDFSNSKEKLTLVASQNEKQNSLKINQDINVFMGRIQKNKEIIYPITTSRYFWIQVSKGEIKINNLIAKQGDGIYGENEEKIVIYSNEQSEFILFDLN